MDKAGKTPGKQSKQVTDTEDEDKQKKVIKKQREVSPIADFDNLTPG